MRRILPLLVFGAAPTGTTPVPKPLGTVLGDTFAAACSEPKANEVRLTTYLSTSDGSWSVDYELERESGGHGPSYEEVPPGTLTEPDAMNLTVPAGETKEEAHDFVQTAPAKGFMSWRSRVMSNGGTHRCHFVVLAIPSA